MRVMRDDAYMFKTLRALVAGMITNYGRYEWTLQGFGMLRTYVGADLWLHIWDSKFRVRDVSDIHDHPWHFSSLVVNGVITNTRYRVRPCLEEERAPFIKSQIVCGPGGNNDSVSLRERGEGVRLERVSREEYKTGAEYQQRANEVHHTQFSDGAVTLVQREFLPDTEHAHVFFKADESRVSAEPVEASAQQVAEICRSACARWETY